MIEVSTLLIFIVLMASLIIMPGIDFFFISLNTARYGVFQGLATVLGISFGCFTHAMIAGFGFSQLLLKHVWMFEIIRWSGIAYLLWIGGKVFLEKQKTKGAEKKQGEIEQQSPDGNLVVKGYLINILNPKVPISIALFFLPFIDISAGHIFLQFLFWGTVFSLTAFVVFSFVVFVTKWLHGYFVENKRLLYFSGKISGIIFFIFAVRLFLAMRPI